MIELATIIPTISQDPCPHTVTLTLDHDRRQHSRLRVRLDDGREAAVMLARGVTLHDGDLLAGTDGSIVRVCAAAEAVTTAIVADPTLFAHACYHLGNRHVPLQIGPGWLRYREDHVLDEMLRELGIEARHELAPFEPGRGAYAARESDTAAPMTQAPLAMLLQVLHFASPTLPVGGFAYSQGIEQAVEQGWIHDEASTADWLLGLMAHVHVRQELPLFARLYRAWQSGDDEAVTHWNERLIASRESAELRAEERDTGAALARLLGDLGVPRSTLPTQGYASMFARAAVHWRIPLSEAATAWLWSWCQNQVAAAVRLVPLGQTAGQRLLQRLITEIPARVEAGLACDDAAIGFSAPGLALASARHESQYTRLFLS